jgi:uncharacterized protein YeaO (DUF488 family)
MTVRAKRVYEPVAATDGRRYLVDRLWPRGFSKASLWLDDWLKELAPSAELCDWYDHDPQRFPAFRQRYRAELKDRTALLRRLVEEARSGAVTLLFAARDTDHSNAAVLRELLAARLARSSQKGRRRPVPGGASRSSAAARHPPPRRPAETRGDRRAPPSRPSMHGPAAWESHGASVPRSHRPLARKTRAGERGRSATTPLDTGQLSQRDERIVRRPMSPPETFSSPRPPGPSRALTLGLGP